MFVRSQRDSGDDEDMDKNSEDEEGQLEEQIERLQEKVESAQSEQKNLFLVIFQVRMTGSQVGPLKLNDEPFHFLCCPLVATSISALACTLCKAVMKVVVLSRAPHHCV